MQLGFDLLDELAFSAAKGGNARPTTKFMVQNLGTVIELLWLLRTGLQLPGLSELADTRRVRLVQAIDRGQRTAIFSNNNGHSQLITCFWTNDEEPDEWFEFCQSLQNGAVTSGFPHKNAQELVAATRELVSNVFEHSDAPQSGLVGFSIIRDKLEIVVGDQGIGVLASLRTSPEYSVLRDSGEALRASLTDGTSRFGRLSGHGGGFRNLFRGLLNLSSDLRFRSGDHALSINGISPELSTGRISQKIQLPGFVVSIACAARSRSSGI
jgi:hypothetical protein